MSLFCSTEQWHHKASQSFFSVQWGTPLFCFSSFLPFFVFFCIFGFFCIFVILLFFFFFSFCHFVWFVFLSCLSFYLVQSFDQRNTAFISIVIKQLMWLPPRQGFVGFGWLNQEASQSICHKASQSLGSEKHPSSALLFYYVPPPWWWGGGGNPPPSSSYYPLSNNPFLLI